MHVHGSMSEDDSGLIETTPVQVTSLLRSTISTRPTRCHHLSPVARRRSCSVAAPEIEMASLRRRMTSSESSPGRYTSFRVADILRQSTLTDSYCKPSPGNNIYATTRLHVFLCLMNHRSICRYFAHPEYAACRLRKGNSTSGCIQTIFHTILSLKL